MVSGNFTVCMSCFDIENDSNMRRTASDKLECSTCFSTRGKSEISCIGRLPTISLTLKAVAQRDSFYRTHVLHSVLDNAGYGEESVVRKVIIDYCMNVSDTSYKYVYGYEYECIPGYTQYGKGDLIMTDGNRNFLVVECKYLDYWSTGKTASTRRTKHRKQVREQARDYMDRFERHLTQHRMEWSSIRAQAVVNNPSGIELACEWEEHKENEFFFGPNIISPHGRSFLESCPSSPCTQDAIICFA